MRKTLLAIAVMSALAAECAPAKVVADDADYVEPPFKPLAIDAEGIPAEGLFTYNFWRILSPAEKTNGTQRICKMWKDATACQVIPDGCASSMEVTELKDGRYLVDWTFTVVSADLPPLPRVGLAFPLVKTFSTVHWYGRGPWENYPDRRNGAKLGVYSADMGLVADAEPNFGYRSACRWLEVSQPNGKGMRIEAVNAPFGFSVRPRTDKVDGFFVHIDAYISSLMSLKDAKPQRPETYRISFLVSEL